MSTQISTNIKDLLKNQPRNTVVTAKGLLGIGISREQQRSLVRSGWLKRLGIGAYTMLNDVVELPGAIYALQRDLALTVHEGGYTALSLRHGLVHNVVADRRVELFCPRSDRLPRWFLSSFSPQCSLHTVSVFEASTGLLEQDTGAFSLKVSSPERAMLEMLYLSPDIHSLAECFQLMELLVTVRPALVQALLQACTSVKVKRLFLYMAELVGHSWLKRLDLAQIDLGKGVREITKGGRLDKKYQLVIGEVRLI